MNCKEVQRKLETWLDGELDESVGRRLHAHLEQCASCMARAQQQRALSGLLRCWPDQPTTPGFRSRLLTRILQREREWHNLYFLSGMHLGQVASVDPAVLLQADSSRPVLTYREYTGAPEPAQMPHTDVRYVQLPLPN